MTPSKQILLIIVLLFNACFSFSQNNKYLIGSFPIEIIDNKYILFQAKVNNEKTLTFFFDTGAASTLLDKESAKGLKITSTNEISVSGAGGEKKYELAENQRVNIQDIEIDSIDFVLEDLTRLKKSLGRDFDGIIGYSLLKNFITEINIDQKVINLYPRNTILNLSSYTPQTFEFRNNIPIPQINIEIQLKNGTRLNGCTFFDSGAGLSLLCNTPFAERTNIINSTKKRLTNNLENLSNSSQSKAIALNSLTFSGYNFQNIPISVASDKAGVSSFDGYLGIMGAEIIYRFNIVLDYDNKKLYVKPNHIFKNSFDPVLTGFSIKKNDSNQIYISEIAVESPAYKKGIRKGDLLLAVNNNKSQDKKEYNSILKKEGKRVTLLIKSKDKQIKKYKIHLKNLLD